MHILSEVEQDRFERPPTFNSTERKQFFDFPQSAMNVAQDLRSPENQIGFLLTYGYFRAVRRFFWPNYFYDRDIAYVANMLGVSPDLFSAQDYKGRTRRTHQRRILELQGFRPFDDQAKPQVVTEIATMARRYLKPRLIFGRCIDFLAEKRIQVPSTRRLTDLIRVGLKRHKDDLVRTVEAHMTAEVRQVLDELFMQEDGSIRYRLTLLKKISQSMRPRKIMETAEDFKTISDVYQKIMPVLADIDIDLAGIRYFAGTTMRSNVLDLGRRLDADRYLHAIAFIAHQHHRLQDALVDILINAMSTFENSVKREHKDQVFVERQSVNNRLETVLHAIDTNALDPLRQIRCVVEDDTLADAVKLDRIGTILDQGHEDAIDRLQKDIRESSSDDMQYRKILEAKSQRLQNRINPILRQITFTGDDRTADLLATLAYFREKDGKLDPKMPLDFLTPDERKAVLNTSDGFRISLCKVYLFQHVVGAVKAGNLNLDGSYKYRPMDDYLISKDRWEKEKTELLARAGLSEFADPRSVLNTLNKDLHQEYLRTNRAASNGSNPYLKVVGPGDFHVRTPALGDVETDPMRSIMPKRLIPLSEVLATVHQHCGMLDEFKHWQQTHLRKPPAPAVLIAGIMGFGCAIGTEKMGRISKAVEARELENAVNWRFSIDNIIAANDKVIEVMDRMELPRIYRNSTTALHTSSDGQKFEVRQPSLNASYSFKYFGQLQGVSAYSFIDERGLLWYSLVISPAERESTYVIDGLMHNDVVKSTIHSTDEHGFKEAIFCLTHLLGISYAPRFKNLKKQTLYHFRNRKNEGGDWMIAPKKYVNEKVILESWDDLLRLIVTIKLKEATASSIFRRLNSYSHQHRLYQAMKAFGQIIKSMFILHYIDQVELRQAIEKQLNKIELANGFTRAVAVGNPNGLEHADKADQEIAEGCNRLIRNSIVCWNYLYLTQKITLAKTEEERKRLLDIIETHSPQSWGSFNMLGEFDFSDEKLQDTTGVLPPKKQAKIIPENWGPPNR